MKFIIAPDGALTAMEISQAIQIGLSRVYPSDDYELVPMAEGGEETVESLINATHGKLFSGQVIGPLGTQVTAKFGILGDDKTGIIETSQASGIQYVDEEIQNPLITTTYGTGELIERLLDHDIKKLIMGIDNSAANDSGAGMAQAIGVHLLNQHGDKLMPGGGTLGTLAYIDTTHIDPRIKDLEILTAVNVINPLVGRNGTSAVFGPQKGATPEISRLLDNHLKHFATIIKNEIGKDLAYFPGTGAAGGLGAGLLAFTNTTMKKDVGIAVATKNVSPNAPVIIIARSVNDGICEIYAEKSFNTIFASVAEVKTSKDPPYIIAQTSKDIIRLIEKIKNHFY